LERGRRSEAEYGINLRRKVKLGLLAKNDESLGGADCWERVETITGEQKKRKARGVEFHKKKKTRGVVISRFWETRHKVNRPQKEEWEGWYWRTLEKRGRQAWERERVIKWGDDKRKVTDRT